MTHGSIFNPGQNSPFHSQALRALKDNAWAKRKYKLLLSLTYWIFCRQNHACNTPCKFHMATNVMFPQEQIKCFFKNAIHKKRLKKSANSKKWFATSCFNLFSCQIVRSTVTYIIRRKLSSTWCLLYYHDVTMSRLSTRHLV